MKTWAVVVLGSTLCVAGCATQPMGVAPMSSSGKPQFFDVDVEVEEDNGTFTLEIQSGPQCPTVLGPENGCIEVGLEKMGVIVFRLEGGDVTSCEGEPEETWVWKGVSLTELPNVTQTGNTYEKKYSKISTKAQADFYAEEYGDISFLSPGGQEMVILDMNSSAYTIWYELTAVQCGTGKEAKTDPRIKNHGGFGRN